MRQSCEMIYSPDYSLDELNFMSSIFAENHSSDHPFTPECQQCNFSMSSTSTTPVENSLHDQTAKVEGPAAKELKSSNTTWNSSYTTSNHLLSAKASSSYFSHLISFENSNFPPGSACNEVDYCGLKASAIMKPKVGLEPDGNMTFPPLISQDLY